MNWSELLHSGIAYRFGWTIFHSIWQIGIVGLFLFILLRLFKNQTAKSRYLLSFSALLTVFAISIISFYSIVVPEKESPISVHHVKNPNTNLLIQIEETTNNSMPTNWFTFNEIKNSISPYTYYLFALWAIGLVFYILKLIGGLIYLNRIKIKAKGILPAAQQDIFDSCLKKLKLRNARIKIRRTELINSPMLIGILKPVILLPTGMLSGISTDHLEAVFLHELAHLKRADYLFNLLQTLLESIYFYHPVIWWISSQIRIERENACDDLVTNQHMSELSYAKALAFVQEYEVNHSSLVLAFTSSKQTVMDRIKRLFKPRKLVTGLRETLFVGLVLCLSIVFMSHQFVNKKDTKVTTLKIEGIKADSTINGIKRIHFIDTFSVPGKKIITKELNQEEIAAFEANLLKENNTALTTPLLEVYENTDSLNHKKYVLPKGGTYKTHAKSGSNKEYHTSELNVHPDTTNVEYVSIKSDSCTYYFSNIAVSDIIPIFQSLSKDNKELLEDLENVQFHAKDITFKDSVFLSLGEKVDLIEEFALSYHMDSASFKLDFSPEDFHFKFNIDSTILINHDSIRQIIDENRKEIERELAKIDKEELRRLKAEHEKLSREFEREMAKAKRDIAREERIANRQLERAQKDVQKELEHAEKELADSDDIESYELENSIRKYMETNRLIAPKENFTIVITRKKVRLNGKKLPSPHPEKITELCKEILQVNEVTRIKIVNDIISK